MIVNYRRWCAIGTSTDSGRKLVRSNFPNTTTTTTTTQARSCSQRKHKQQDPVLLQGPKFFFFSFYLPAHYPRDQLFPTTTTSTTTTATATTKKYSWSCGLQTQLCAQTTQQTRHKLIELCTERGVVARRRRPTQQPNKVQGPEREREREETWAWIQLQRPVQTCPGTNLVTSFENSVGKIPRNLWKHRDL
jgi:hypothetical protein